MELGLTRHAIQHRIERGRLHVLWPGVYAVGHRHVTRHGRWIGAVLAAGPGAVLSHESAAALWGIRDDTTGDIEVSIPRSRRCRHRAIRAHRRSNLAAHERAEHEGIPVTAIATTLADLAARLPRQELERAINEADRLELIDPGGLRAAIEGMPPRAGVAGLRSVLDRRTFVLTRSHLERLFVPIARGAGLSQPETQRWINGFEVDFFWPDLGLVVETDGLRYHRTPAQQTRDRLRDQAHMSAGLTPLRFTHAQVKYESGHVRRTLSSVALRLRTLAERAAS